MCLSVKYNPAALKGISNGAPHRLLESEKENLPSMRKSGGLVYTG
jgi:hypothetical protein